MGYNNGKQKERTKMINFAIGIIILAAAGILVTVASVQKANDSLLRKIEDEEQMEWIRQYCNKKE